MVLHAAVVENGGDDGLVEDAVNNTLEAGDEDFAENVGVV